MNGECTRDTACPPQPRRPGGFTLLELLVVMTIMIFITTIVLMNTLGGTRSSAYASAANDVLNSCMLGHQRACIDGTKTFLFMTDSSNFCLVRWVGTASKVYPNANNLMMDDFYTDLSQYTNSTYSGSSALIMVDMDKGLSAGVTNITINSGVSTGNGLETWTNAAFELTLVPTNNTTLASLIANWSAGDNYGIALQSSQMLPKGFHFELGNTVDGASPAGNYIVFNPDGTLTCGCSLTSPPWPSGSPWSLSIAEDIRSGFGGTTGGKSVNNRVILQFKSTGQILRTQ